MKTFAYLTLLLIVLSLGSCTKEPLPMAVNVDTTATVVHHGYWLIESDSMSRQVSYMIHVDTATVTRGDGSTFLSTNADSVVVINLDSATGQLQSILNVGRLSPIGFSVIYYPYLRDSLLSHFEYNVPGDSDLHALQLGGHLTATGMVGTLAYVRDWPSKLNYDYSIKGITTARVATQSEVDKMLAIRVGNANSHVFHEVHCSYVKAGLVNPSYFWNRDSAIANGYTPDASGKCQP